MVQSSHIVRVLLVLIASMNCSCAWSQEFSPGQRAGILESSLVREASGIAASRKNTGVLWVHNDSGDAPQLFALDTKANLLGICTVSRAQARDWEDIAVGPGPEPGQHYLYIGDIGDNRGRYPSVRIYRVAEPEIEVSQPFGRMRIGPAETIELTYPGGPRDAETLLVDPLTKDIYLITKRELFNQVYRAPYPQSTSAPTVLTRVATLPWGFAVAGDVSPNGREIIVRSPYNASLWQRPEGQPLWKAFEQKPVGIPLMSEPQGEAIAFDGQGLGYFTISEMEHPPLYYFARKAPVSDSALSDKEGRPPTP